jgi:hypothetical protein
MRKVDLYLRFAAECRTLAARARFADQRETLFEMARSWEVLAQERSRQVGLEHPWARGQSDEEGGSEQSDN